MMVNPDKVADLIAELAETVIRPHHKTLDPERVRQKSSVNDLVTDIDEEMERVLRSALKDVYPAASFIGEESAAADPAIVDALSGDGAFWVADPIDGTRVFVNGQEEFGVIVSLVENGETQMGWIYGMADRASMTAERGAGVTWRGEALATSKSASERGHETPRGARSVGWLTDEWREPIKANLKAKFETTASHCSAYAYVKTVLGEYDFKLSSRIHAWDHLAGTLMITELGGAVRWLDTRDPYFPSASFDRPLLATAAAQDWELIADGLTSGMA